MPFKTVCEDGDFYLLNAETFTWEKLNVPELQPRAFHTASLHNNNIYIIGGRRCTNTILPFHDITIFHIDNIRAREFHLSSLHITQPIPIQLTYHYTIPYTDNLLCVYGGFQYKQAMAKPDVPEVSKCMHLIDLSETTPQMHDVEAPEQLYETAGHSMLILDSNCIMVCGGTAKHIFLYTSKDISTDPCALGDDCIISMQDLEEKAPSWIFCDGRCQKWYHVLCLKVKNIPSG